MSMKCPPLWIRPASVLTHAIVFSLAVGASAVRALESIPLWPGQVTPKVDVYRPEATTDTGMAVVICPGGGYGGLAADHEGRQPALFFTAHGLTAYVLEYRHGGNGFRHPIPSDDARRALRLAHSRHPDGRVGIMGFSAGGHLAAHVGTRFDLGNAAAPDTFERTSSRPDFLVLCYPVASFDPAITHAGSVKNLLAERATDPEMIQLLSNERHVTPETPPTFLFHTTTDGAVKVENSLRFYEALRKCKIPCELHVYGQGDHGVGLMQGDPILGTWPGHLAAWLRSEGLLARKVERAAVSGTVTLNDQPVSWATLVFTPEDPKLRRVAARVRHGKYSLTAETGVPLGPQRLAITLSTQDAPHVSAPLGVFTMEEATHATGNALTTLITPGKNDCSLTLKR
jgi:acetyl esterase/lipase